VRSAPVFVVRHAKAGRRSDWDGPDALRPLTKAGRRQADGIADQLAGRGVTRVLTSPFVRCRETVTPLADHLQLPMVDSTALIEGAPLSDALRLVEKVADQPTVLCTHGDVIGEILEHLHRHGLVNGDTRLEKGSTWVLDTDGGAITGARYLPPPA
jgi:phosphohistidine phosphatase SixA